MSIKGNAPTFVRSESELTYYDVICDDLIATRTELQFKDRNSVGMLAVNLSLVDACMESINREGMVITYEGDRKEVTKANPAVAMLKDAQMAVRHYLKEFGMSPNSRTNTGLRLGGGSPAGGLQTKDTKIDRFNR